jgi:dTDP-4-dehydrorhamnose 3,5-epimerase-like enzyme
VIRGLHYHERGQDDLFVCLQGMARVVVLDRESGETFTEDIRRRETRSRSTSPGGTRTASRR